MSCAIRPVRFSAVFFFFFNDTATTEIYTLSYTTLFRSARGCGGFLGTRPVRAGLDLLCGRIVLARPRPGVRSEEHTSELQSQSNLVCRLLLEKKKKCRN